MKRTKIILNTFVVSAIVIGTLAFTRKPFATAFCVKTGSAGTCTNFITNQGANPAGNLYRGYASTDPRCPQQCATAIRLLDQE